jgi:hypothetical protein
MQKARRVKLPIARARHRPQEFVTAYETDPSQI